MQQRVTSLFFLVCLAALVGASTPLSTNEDSEAPTNIPTPASTPVPQADINCPTFCRSYVYYGMGYTFRQIGPQTVLAWNVVSATSTSVTRVSVDLYVTSQRYVTFTLSDSSPVITQAYNLSSGNVYGNGTFTLYPGYSTFGGVPQLGVNWQSGAYGVKGGYNGSVIVFNLNTPSPANSRNISSNNITLGWTACISSRFGSTELVNATVWTSINNNTIGAAFLDLFRYPVQYLYYSVGAARSSNSTNATLTLSYTPTGIKVDSTVCVPPLRNCVRNTGMLFDVSRCPTNTLEEEERDNKERYPNQPIFMPTLASMSSSPSFSSVRPVPVDVDALPTPSSAEAIAVPTAEAQK